MIGYEEYYPLMQQSLRGDQICLLSVYTRCVVEYDVVRASMTGAFIMHPDI